MKKQELFQDNHPIIIGALHLPPTLASHRSSSQTIQQIVDFSLRNVDKAVQAGIPALYIQDLGDIPFAPRVQPHTIATLSVVGSKIREKFPKLVLGVCTMAHGAREPLAVAQAVDAQFVRIKVYTGAMVKAEGIIQGCAYEAIQYRAEIGGEEIKILADVYDRTGVPLGMMPLAQAANFTATHSRADALILTGSSTEESLKMLKEVKDSGVGAPILVGGGANAENIKNILDVADGVIVSSSFKPKGGWSEEGMADEWDIKRIEAFMRAVEGK